MTEFRHAILRRPGPDAGDGLTTAGQGRPDHRRLLAQHQAYAAALSQLGLSLTLLDPLPGCPDAYFVEDVAVVTPELAVITRPGARVRRAEAKPMAPVLAAHRPLATIETPGTLEGGDVLQIERQLFVGLSARTNAAGAAQLAALLAPHDYQVTTIPVAAGLHLKSAVAYLGDGTLLLTPALAEESALARFRHIVVDAVEAYAANALMINGRLLVAAGFPALHARLRAAGYELLPLETSELEKMDGGLSCLSLRLT